MLILDRRKGESIIIGENIKVIFIEVTGNKIRLGIDAPKDVKVDREEIRIIKNRERERSGIKDNDKVPYQYVDENGAIRVGV